MHGCSTCAWRIRTFPSDHHRYGTANALPSPSYYLNTVYVHLYTKILTCCEFYEDGRLRKCIGCSDARCAQGSRCPARTAQGQEEANSREEITVRQPQLSARGNDGASIACMLALPVRMLSMVHAPPPWTKLPVRFNVFDDVHLLLAYDIELWDSG